MTALAAQYTWVISNRDAARRQLVEAIRMYFLDGDPVCIHTLAGAAREMYEKTCEALGVERMFDHIRAANQGASASELWSALNRARNFFKHLSDDPDAAIALTDADNRYTLFIGSHDCAQLCGEDQPIEVQVFNVWFLAVELAAKDGDDDAGCSARELERLFPGFRRAPLAEQKAAGRTLLAKASGAPDELADWLESATSRP